jgi:hypothetical protein
MSPRSRPNDNFGINNQGVNETVGELLWLSCIEWRNTIRNLKLRNCLLLLLISLHGYLLLSESEKEDFRREACFDFYTLDSTSDLVFLTLSILNLLADFLLLPPRDSQWAYSLHFSQELKHEGASDR